MILSLHCLTISSVGVKRRLTPVVQLTLPRELIHAVDRWAAREGRRRLGERMSRSQAVRELLVFALETKQPVHLYRLGEEPKAEDVDLSPRQRIAMIGELTRDAYQMKGEPVVSGIRRDVVRVVRRGR